MKIIKKPIIFITILTLIIASLFTFSSCSNDKSGDPEAVNITDQELFDEMLAVSKIAGTGKNYPADITSYIKTKAEDLDLSFYRDTSGNIIVEKPATPGREDEPTTILESGLYSNDTVNLRILSGAVVSDTTKLSANRNAGIASILCILKKSTDHGPIRAIFIADDESSFADSNNISEKYITEVDTIVGFLGTKGINLYTSAPSAKILETNFQAEIGPPKGRYAYVISASGFPKMPYTYDTNPVKAITELLTEAKTGGLYFELSSLFATAAPLHSPEEATAIVVFDDYEMKRFKTLFTVFEQNYLSNIPNGYENVKLQLVETRLPADVLTDEYQSRVIAYLYGALSTEDTSANVSLYNLSLAHGAFSGKTSVSGLKEESIDKVSVNQISVATFSSVSLAVTDSVPGFSTSAKSKVVTSLSDYLRSVSNKNKDILSLDTINELSFLSNGNADISTVSLGWSVEFGEDGREYLKLASLSTPANAVLDLLAKS